MSILNSYESYLNLIKPRVKSDWQAFVAEKEELKTKFESLGWPKRKEESWKNSSVKFLTDFTFKQEAVPTSAITSLITELKTLLIPGFHHIVVVNGVLFEEASTLSSESSLTLKADTVPAKWSLPFAHDDLENKSSFTFSKAFSLLNELYQFQKVSLTVKEGAKLSKPVQVLNYVYSETQQSLNANPSLEIFLEKNSTAQILVSYQGPQGVKYFNNACLSVQLKEGANLELVNETKQSYQAFHLDQNQISIGENAQLKYLDFNTSAQWARHELVVNLEQSGASAQVLGGALLQKNEHCDHQTKIHFKKSHTQSEQLYKSILDDEARSVFCGTVFIDKNIEQVSSAQLNNNLLISDKAEANSKPVLWIYSDDVKASHGSTVGQLNPDELYYLQTRAISKDKAVSLLSAGFLLELVERLENKALKSYLSESLNQKFKTGKERPALKSLK